MALTKSKFSQLPEDAVVLTEQQALQFQSGLIKNWTKPSDVLALRYGPYILGGAAFLSGIFLNNHFRKKFMLGTYGRLSTYLPVCAMPATMTLLLHSEMVLPDVLLMKGDQCPVCLELRAGAFQSMLGVIFPLLIAPLGCASIAQRYATINLPYITDKPREILQIFKKMFKPISTNVWYLFLGQALLGSIVTYFEIKSIIKVSQTIALEEERESNS